MLKDKGKARARARLPTLPAALSSVVIIQAAPKPDQGVPEPGQAAFKVSQVVAPEASGESICSTKDLVIEAGRHAVSQGPQTPNRPPPQATRYPSRGNRREPSLVLLSATVLNPLDKELDLNPDNPLNLREQDEQPLSNNDGGSNGDDDWNGSEPDSDNNLDNKSKNEDIDGVEEKNPPVMVAEYCHAVHKVKCKVLISHFYDQLKSETRRNCHLQSTTGRSLRLAWPG